ESGVGKNDFLDEYSAASGCDVRSDMRIRFHLVLGFIWILSVAPHGRAQTSDDLFNGDVLQEIRLYISPTDYATFKQTNFVCQQQDLEALAGQYVSPLPRVECWFPTEFHWTFQGRDITLPQVAVNSHGKGSRS